MLNPNEIKQNLGRFRFYALLVTGLLLSTYIGYRLGFHVSIEQATSWQQAQHTLQNLKEENDLLTRRLNILGVELDVERLAAQTAQANLQKGLEREAELAKQLNFYQKVMAPELTSDGFVIDDFVLLPAVSARHFHFEIVLMQTKKIKSVVKGNVQVTLSGSMHDQPTNLAFSELVEPSDSLMSFSFKYFQVLSGQLSIPEGFEPEQAKIDAEIFQFKRKKGDLTRVFSWQDSISSSVDKTTER